MNVIHKEKILYSGFLILYAHNISKKNLSYIDIQTLLNSLKYHISNQIIQESHKWLINIKALKLSNNCEYEITNIGKERLKIDMMICTY